jgi:putative hydrolase of the HAD superfamily
MAGALSHVQTWIFDLDNTLYPVTRELLADIDRHIGAFVAEFLGVDRDEARRIQKQYFRDYGLTLKGLMVEHGLDPAIYFDHMQREDLYDMAPAPDLAATIAQLPGRKLVYTNSSIGHTTMVLERLGMTGLFENVFDITAADFVPKPQPESMDTLCRKFSVAAGRACMVDDIARNLAPAAARGMATVWLETDAEWASYDPPGPHVQHKTRDLHAFLRAILDARG